MMKSILSLVFPWKCILCGKVLLDGEADVCQSCLSHVPPCPEQKRTISGIGRWTALWVYEGAVRQALLRYKFRGRRSYGKRFGRLLAKKVQEEFSEDFDLIVYVPISTARKWKRGYDQVWLLVKAMGKILEIEPIRVLKKTRNNAAQSSLHGSLERERNVRGVYKVIQPHLVAGKRVLLVDDIITTGSTVKECAAMLRAAGAKEVLCAAIAVTQGRNR